MVAFNSRLFTLQHTTTIMEISRKAYSGVRISFSEIILDIKCYSFKLYIDKK